MTRALPYEATPGPTTRPRRTRRARRGLRRLRFHRIRLVRTGSDRTFEQFALVEDRVVAHQRHQVRRVHHAPASCAARNLATALGHFAPQSTSNALSATRARSTSSALEISRIATSTPLVHRLRQHGKHIGLLAPPTALLTSVRGHLPQARLPEIQQLSPRPRRGPHAPSCWTSPILQNVRLMGPLRRHIMGNLCLQLGRNHFPDRRIHPRKLDHHAHAMSGH